MSSKDNKNNENGYEISSLVDVIQLEMKRGEFIVEKINKDSSIQEIIYVKNEMLSLYETIKGVIASILPFVGANLGNEKYVKGFKELLQLQFDTLSSFNKNSIDTLSLFSSDNEEEKDNVYSTKDIIDKKRKDMEEKRIKDNENKFKVVKN